MARLLFDENLSHRLSARLAKTFPASVHARDVGLLGAGDPAVWSFAAAQGFVLVTKDDDFRQLALLRGAPPKVVWLVVGNAGTERVAVLLEAQSAAIEAFAGDAAESLMVLKMLARR